MNALAEAYLVAGFLLFCRIGAVLMVIPGFSSARVAVRIRLLAAVALTIALFPLMAEEVLGRLSSADAGGLARAVASEVLIGVAIGLIARIYLLALEFIMSAVAMSIGYGGMLGPPIEGSDPQAALSALVSFTALMILFAADFHHIVLRAALFSYDAFPAGSIPDPRVLLADLVDTLAVTFSIALRLGSPFIGFAIIANMLVGALNKLAVQIPIYFVALPAMLLGALVILYFNLPFVLTVFGDNFDLLYRGF
ncbi:MULTISPECIES: flagellar biosynthetic protein FliR [unclassified Roseitalea]|uniref:flagellar biosynthetic protein FliR n=1 Tax=unclassified Roseitalea TaxID=2639107 RepID=UPI00273F1231|nr:MULTISPECIES: flagellar biosynthetic protein FliR [unclassified Roseitalea]